MLGVPELEAVSQLGSQKSSIEMNNLLPATVQTSFHIAQAASTLCELKSIFSFSSPSLKVYSQ